MSLRVFFVAGERSGDRHAAAVMGELRALDEDVAFAGFGGCEMREAGGDEIEDWVEEAGVVGLSEVLKKYGYFKRKFREAQARIAAWKPDAVVFVDYPGFNLRLANALHAKGDGAKRVYFISPQVWAWNRGRIPKMAKVLDRMLCIFPFEVELYEQSGLTTRFVGHPLVERLGTGAPAGNREKRLVGLFPGSRAREVGKLFPAMLEAARRLVDSGVAQRVIASAASERVAALMREMIGDARPWLELKVGGSEALMRRCGAGVVASGTATLEAAFCGMPYCLVYRVAPMTYVMGKLLVRVPFLGIVNILAGREVVRELIQGDATAEKIEAELALLLDDGERRSAVESGLREVRESLGSGGMAASAAREIMASVNDQ